MLTATRSLALCFLLACACGPSSSTSTSTAPPGGEGGQGSAAPGGGAAGPEEVPLESVGLSKAAMDPGADPCFDFYQYACGGWLESTEIPADRARWSRGFNEIHQENEETLHRLLEEAAAGKIDGEAADQAGRYYAACMDEEAVEEAGLSGLEPLLEAARDLRRRRDITDAAGELHAHGIMPVFSIDVDQDFEDPELVIAYFEQGGLGLPDRDYYLKDDDESKELRELYVKHVERMLKLAEMPARRAKRAARDVMKLETELARVSKTRVEMRDYRGIYNKVDAEGLAEIVPAFAWDRYFDAIGRPDLKDISISGEKFFAGFQKLLKKTPSRAWSHYLQWRVLHESAVALPKAFVDERFVLKRALSGQEEQRPRWKRCVSATDEALPHHVGKLYVGEKFGPEAKQAAETLVGAISEAFAAEVEGYSWMDDATRERALEKREMMAYLIGYPDEWESYDFEIAGDNYARNAVSAGAWHMDDELSKVGEPTDRKEWLMSASTVNAYYHPLKNHMVFPAGILQAPFFDAGASVAVQAGGLGMIVGHELTHGFDDQGSKFAGNGALENWWQEEVKAKFQEKTQCVVDQYAGYEVLPGAHINGELTLGENIADMGGVKLAHLAYRRLREGEQPRVAGGFDEDQQFFLAVGQAWCSKSREERARTLLKTDSHSPARFRVNGSLANLPAFSEAFECAEGTPMNRENMCSVW